MDIKEAVISAGTTRFRPIVLTTITTIVGVLPITLSSELWGGLGYTIIFGLFVSAGLTLFMVPLLYNRFVEKRI
jgi:multidrug efflux pump subunit AcrB